MAQGIGLMPNDMIMPVKRTRSAALDHSTPSNYIDNLSPVTKCKSTGFNRSASKTLKNPFRQSKKDSKDKNLSKSLSHPLTNITPLKKSRNYAEAYELPLSFSTMLFEDPSYYLVHFFLETNGKKLHVLLKAIIELSIVESCSPVFISKYMKQYLDATGQTIPLNNLLTFEIVPSQGNRTKIVPKSTTVEFEIWMLPYQFITTKCKSIIKQIDKNIAPLIENLIETLGALTPMCEEITTISDLNRNHIFHNLAWTAFPGLEPKYIMEHIFNVCFNIIEVIEEELQNLPHDVIDLFVECFGFIGNCSNYSDIFFWCFLCPLLNIFTFNGLRRSKMYNQLFDAFIICVVLLQEVMSFSSNNNTIFNEISTSEIEKWDELRKKVLSLKSLFSKNYDQDLGDTILHYCSVTDDEKSTLILGEELLGNLKTVWKDLLDNHPNHKLLFYFVPFARNGIMDNQIV